MSNMSHFMRHIFILKKCLNNYKNAIFKKCESSYITVTILLKEEA